VYNLLMKMKEHILMAMKEQFKEWEALLAELSEEQITASHFDLDWSIKDIVAHLWAWQQISVARVEAGAFNREPEFPKWIIGSNPNWEANADKTNALTYKNNHNKLWKEIHQNWKDGYSRLLDAAHKIPEPNLLATGLYPWLGEYSLALILIASYDHHQEHFDKLTKWLNEHKV
jgi:hypothetical protein